VAVAGPGLVGLLPAGVVGAVTGPGLAGLLREPGLEVQLRGLGWRGCYGSLGWRGCYGAWAGGAVTGPEGAGAGGLSRGRGWSADTGPGPLVLFSGRVIYSVWDLATCTEKLEGVPSND
jgi:hypothetical protein